MIIKVLKTYEIDDSLWEQITDGFNEAYGKKISKDALKNGYCIANQLGYAYHAIAFSDDGEVAGYNVFSPTIYKNNIKILVSGSTYVRQRYRKDAFIFLDMVNALRDECKLDGYHVEIGVPNNNSKEFALKILKYNYISDLDYYILPLNLSRVLKNSRISFFDSLIKWGGIIYAKIQLCVSILLNDTEREAKYEIEVNNDYLKCRFRNKSYSKYENKKFKAFYRVVYEDKAKTIYLMDFRENLKRTKYALASVVNYIIEKENPDAILYVGSLNLKQSVLIKVPYKYIPKHLPLTFRILDKSKKDKFKDMAEISNWNFGLMNFDVR